MRTRALPAGLAVGLALLLGGTGSALGANAECSNPSGTWTQLQSAAGSGTPFTLSCSLSAPDTAGTQLVVGSGVSFTLDLDGSDLTVAPVSASEPAIEVPSTSTLEVRDSAGTGLLSAGATVDGMLSVDSGATVSVPAGQTLTINDAATNNGIIALAGTLTGSGTLDNEGAISEAASTWSIPGDGSPTGGLTITGNRYELTFSVEFGQAPSSMWVFAPTVAASGESLPNSPPPGYTVAWDADNAAVSSTTELSPLATLVDGVQTIELSSRYTAITPTITYTLTSKHRQGAHGWWLAPVTVTFVCSGPPGLTLECPHAVTLSHSGKGFSASGTVVAANETSASATADGIKIDLTKPTVRITGPRAGHRYSGAAPKAHCHGKDEISGITSCKLTRDIRRHDGIETVTYRALATSGSGRTAKTKLTVTVVPA